MMDHARHLSSPSPTSPFLFHHSERPFKSNPLTPLLSSTADVTGGVDDCFSTTSSNISPQGHNPFEHNQHPSLVDNHHHHHHHHHNHHHQQQNQHQRHSDQCVIDQDSLTGVDDDDGMHNMLSGSSTSSTSTMPLLTENHSHHSFSRISLEEYSPLSLVEDCDNALPISPTSLACGSHHSFKSSLNGLKMDNLVGDEVNDDVNDARSLSPSLLSTTTNNHHNLWSNSSTAITQNTSLLNSTSTSFLLSQHHQHQLNTLIQQLEPQSLDEPPVLISNSSNQLESGTLLTNRPSSEPPSGIGLESAATDVKSLNCQSQQPKLDRQAGKKTDSIRSSTISVSLSTSNRSRKSRNRSVKHRQSNNNGSNCSTSSISSGSSGIAKVLKNERQRPETLEQLPVNSSKIHLQLNHHKKLKELQQRLFGSSINNNESSNKLETNNSCKIDSISNIPDDAVPRAGIKEEPDSSAGSKEDINHNVDNQIVANKTRIRTTRSRKTRAAKVNETCNPSSSTQPNNMKTVMKVVATESVEPDTTTKSSDCIKLADLLSNANETKFIGVQQAANNRFTPATETNDSDTGEKRQVQQLQVQVGPALAVMANGKLVQSLGIQQQHQANGTIITSGSSLNNQIICRPQTVLAGPGSQLKGVMSNTELVKGGDNLLSSWPIQANNIASNNNNSNNLTMTGNQTIGAHQIAIQVICQDGTSLVLPVSTAAGLNTAVSLNSQHQLQAVLANNANQQRNSNQLLPLLSVSNIIAQQQLSALDNGASTSSSSASNSSNQTSVTNQTTAGATSGLAASSPTLAALLDAGSNRINGNNNDLGNFSSQNFVSTNLLRKLVSGNGSAELKRAELTLQPSSNALSLASCGGSLVTVCAPNNNANLAGNKNTNNVNGIISAGTKRIKLENTDSNSIAQTATFSFIEPHSLMVANGNEKTAKEVAEAAQASTCNSGSNAAQQQAPAKANSEAFRQIKMGSSTGNRQVDPTQPFRCEHCNSTFTRLGNFTRHKKIHTVPTKDGQRFKCDVCSKSFLQRCDLARHLHIHRGTEPHRCNICGKGYIRHSDLVTHQRFHNKEKPFGCPHCSKGFCQRGDLNRHLRSIHLQMKPILCPCCNRKFAKQETLLRHLNTAHRSKPGATTAITELPSTLTTQGDDKQTTITVVTSAAP